MPGVYISYPFCAQKCTYCNFASGVFPRALQAQYLSSLESEIRGYAWEWTPETFYLGGGTPGDIPLDSLRSLLKLVPGHPWQEATIEVAPGGVTEERARAWSACGINRVSLGVQSFVDREIRWTGRKHTAQTVADEVDLLRAAGIPNFNVDLIAGLAGQTQDGWQASLDWVERLEAPHVSVYMLEVDEDSRLGAEILRGGARYGASEAPGEDEVASFYETAVERLARMGVARYEISNFARPGFESRHNLKYWKLEPYAGFGADAHSFDGSARGQNPETVEEYLAAGPAHRPRAERTTPRRDERFFVGLRLTEGIRPAPEEWLRFEQPIQRFLDAGLLESADGVLRLTPRGVLLSNEVFQEFLEQ